jgi:hypothetical protein
MTSSNNNKLASQAAIMKYAKLLQRIAGNNNVEA